MSEAQKKNKKLKLKEFYAAENTIGAEGMAHLGSFFKGMNSLEVVDISQNMTKKDPKKVMLPALQALVSSKRTIRSINIAGNMNINNPESIKELQNIINECHHLNSLNISAMQMNKANCETIAKTFIDKFNDKWNLQSDLRELIWNDDFNESPTSALKFMGEDIPNIYNLKLWKIGMCGVFKSINYQIRI